MTAAQKKPRILTTAWFLWDTGMASWHAVMLTFVFSVYVTTGLTDDPNHGTAVLTGATAAGGFVIAVVAPALGSLTDALGKRRLLLSITTSAVIICMVALFFMKPDSGMLWTAAIIMAVAAIFGELSGVFYNGILVKVSNKENMGRVSGTGWAFGYVGGVLALVLVLFLFVQPDVGLFGVTSEGGLKYRAVALFCAAWALLFGLPLMLLAPNDPPKQRAERWTVLHAYVEIGQRFARMWRSDQRSLIGFFISSAFYRDALATIFTVAGVISASVYGFSPTQVILFGVCANVVAGIGVLVGGYADDKFGPRKVILGSAAGIIVLGIIVIMGTEYLRFWIVGLALCLFVGPIASASRTLLAKMSKPGEENLNFGLYATTGRAASFVAPALVSMFTAVTGNARWGMIGILITLAVGAVWFAFVKLGTAGGSSAAFAASQTAQNPDPQA